jgi:hypothetical protein
MTEQNQPVLTGFIPKHKVKTTDSYRKAEPKDNPNLQDENIICCLSFVIWY